jgi:hypothetical protein
MQRPDAPQRLLLLGHGHQLSVGVLREAERRLPPRYSPRAFCARLVARMRSPIRSRSNSAKALTMVRNSRAMPLPLTSSAVAAYNRSHKPLPHSTVRLLGVSISHAGVNNALATAERDPTR